jgi:hypothetical protein
MAASVFSIDGKENIVLNAADAASDIRVGVPTRSVFAVFPAFVIDEAEVMGSPPAN